MRIGSFILAGLAITSLGELPASAQITVAPAARLPPNVKYVVCWARVGSMRYVSDPVIIEERDFEWMQIAFEKAVLPAGQSFNDHACSSGASAAEAMGYVDQLRTRYPETAFNRTGWTGPFKVRGKLYSPPGSAAVTAKPASARAVDAVPKAPPRNAAKPSACKPSASKGSCVSPQ